MQTFLPFDDFKLSAQVLDNKRLGKQRVEVYQILIALIEEHGWVHHPATKMWKGHTNALVTYGLAVCEEWIRRGNKDTLHERIAAFYNLNLDNSYPIWFGNEDFHQSHRSNLLRKDFGYYSKRFDDPIDLPYCWPTYKNDMWVMRFKHAGGTGYLKQKEYKL